MAAVKNFIVVGARRGLLIQVLLGLHAYTDANCVAVCARGTRYLRLTHLCAGQVEVDFEGAEDDLFVEAVNQIGESMPDLVMLCSDCEGARMISRVRHRLNVIVAPTPDGPMLDRFDNKWHFYEFCREHGLRVPESELVESKEKLAFSAVAHKLGLPFIVKPLDQQACTGVHLIVSAEDYRERILANDAYQYAPLVAQRCIKGVDVGLNMLAIHGQVQAIGIQQRVYPQNDEAKIVFFANDYLEQAAHTISRESGYHGVMNVDGRIEERTGDVYLFEANPRYWRSHAASVWCGLNFAAESVERLQQTAEPRVLTSGCADTFYHPVFRPLLWPYIAFGAGHRGHMSRLMMKDFCSLASQARAGLKNGMRKRVPPSLFVANQVERESRLLKAYRAHVKGLISAGMRRGKID
ncbi:ATP-grasp domain-containing protein [Noviherbaspirillum massiliense]|uniref:ATP-grasp domain-containing protein n=1 Tax=Noviherbaspirillum massiliense TaxID=1465823 RepID=UPI00036BABD4|nr:ATP-grasp domain-containing protein [Noviherbaspirillum massiliense]